MALPNRLPVRPSPARLTFITDDMFKAHTRGTKSFTPGEDFGRTSEGIRRGEGIPEMTLDGRQFMEQAGVRGARGGVIRGNEDELDELLNGIGEFKSSELYDDLITKLPKNTSVATAMEMTTVRQEMAFGLQALKAELQMAMEMMPKGGQQQAKKIMSELDSVFDELMSAARSSDGLVKGYSAKGVSGDVLDGIRRKLADQANAQVVGREILENPMTYNKPTPDNPFNDFGDLL
jgi:translation elongation factor EF-1beta